MLDLVSVVLVVTPMSVLFFFIWLTVESSLVRLGGDIISALVDRGMLNAITFRSGKG